MHLLPSHMAPPPQRPQSLWGRGVFLSAFSGDSVWPILLFHYRLGMNLTPRPLFLQAQGQESHRSQYQQNHPLARSSPSPLPVTSKPEYLTIRLWNPSTAEVKMVRNRRERGLQAPMPSLHVIYRALIRNDPMRAYTDVP